MDLAKWSNPLRLVYRHSRGPRAENVPIRIDLAFVHPLVGFIVLTGICRWALVVAMNEQPEGQRKAGTRARDGAQLVAVIVSLVACFGWFLVRWV